ncbi:MAG: methyl-accepting chemotaxis protein [Agathobacter sp.]|nr:methyl-accepting chemotaxis protein [Agathobacter sp.]
MLSNSSSEMERCNRTATIGHCTASLVYIAIAIMDVVLCEKPFYYAIIVSILAIVPGILEITTFLKDKESGLIVHFVCLGFPLLYTFVAFTTSFSCTYIFFLPMFLIVSVYGDLNLLLKENLGVILINLATVIGGGLTGKFGFVDVPTGAIQLTTVVIAAIASVFATRTISRNSKAKLEEVSLSQEKTEKLLKRVIKVSDRVRESINKINDKTARLTSNAEICTESMVEVTVGATDTAEALQSQLRHSERISNKIENVSDSTTLIQKHMNHTLDVLVAGKEDIRILVEKVDHSVNKGASVTSELETLDSYIEQMQSIVELIEGITKQTSLLALNASIEAARAGEAGRGFSVVANEISGMANQTQSATVDITNLINNVSSAINKVVVVVKEMINGINEEKETTEKTTESFAEIEKNTYVVRDNIASLSGNIEELSEANQKIAESIQTVSAISEEVSAHATETLEAERENKENLEHIARRIQDLTDAIQE